MTWPFPWGGLLGRSGDLARRLVLSLPPAKRLCKENKRLRRKIGEIQGEIDGLRTLAEEHARKPVHLPAPPELSPLRLLPFWEVPVLINSYNRLTSLQHLVGWLLRAEHTRIVIIDNASTYPPLLRYLAELEERSLATVIRLDANVGHLAVWRCALLDRLGIDTEYVYTDPDVVPAEFCPPDLIGHLQAILVGNPQIATAGIGLRLDDLPNGYGHKEEVLAWERQFWRTPAAPGLFHASIDTTFALYRPRSGHALSKPAIRTGWPYLAAHEGWYLDHAAPSEEDLFYWRTAAADTSHWSVPQVPAWLQEAAAQQEACRPCLLHAGPDGPELPGYLPMPTESPVAVDDASADGIYLEHAPAWLTAAPARLVELRRMAKHGALLVLQSRTVAPQDMSALLDEAQLATAGWAIERLTYISDPPYHVSTVPDLLRLVRLRPGAIRGMMLHLRAGDSPAAGGAAVVRLTAGTLDEWKGFVRID